MEYYAVFGMLGVALIAIIGFLISIKNNIKEENKPIEELNVTITRLNANFENMLDNDKVRDKRIENHGKEIDDLKENVNNHETRISILERVKKDGCD